MNKFVVLVFLITNFIYSYSGINEIKISNLINYQKTNNNYFLNVNYTFKVDRTIKNNYFLNHKNSNNLKTVQVNEQKNKAEEKANTFIKLISILAIALISILSLLSLSLYKNNLLRLKTNALLEEKNKELEVAKEKAEQASKARTDFLSTVSHELRTPLNAINGITHLLIEENPKQSQLHYLKSLQFSGDYLLHFINDILEINRIDSNKIPIEKLNCNIRNLIENIKNSFNEIAQQNNNIFLVEVDISVPENVICDTTKISQIFINLINNSLKFTKNGYVKLSLLTKYLSDEKVIIEFLISDNGIGIPEDKQTTIFESFSQGSIEINRKYGGTGLGLSIVKKLVELLNGTITLNSKVNLGTTFCITLPFEIGNTLIKDIKTFNDDTFVNLNNKKILLVEDNKINQMITKKMLENKKMKCDVIDNGEEAIEILKIKHNYDLILMDVHLPGINGTIATQKIRQFDNKIPILALTAISLNENRDMLLSYGMNDVITKPFNPKTFYNTISQNLNYY